MSASSHHQERGLADRLTQMSLNGELFDLRFSAVPYATWLAWLDTTSPLSLISSSSLPSRTRTVSAGLSLCSASP